MFSGNHTPGQLPEKLGVAYIVAITLSAVVVSIVMGTGVLCIGSLVLSCVYYSVVTVPCSKAQCV